MPAQAGPGVRIRLAPPESPLRTSHPLAAERFSNGKQSGSGGLMECAPPPITLLSLLSERARLSGLEALYDPTQFARNSEVDAFLNKMYRGNADFVFTVTRDS
jgi:hypothetical protein